MSELKNCPFCGSKPIKRNNIVVFWMECTKCNASTDCFNTEEEAINVWNTRPIEKALLEALKDYLNSGIIQGMSQDSMHYADVSQKFLCLKCMAVFGS